MTRWLSEKSQFLINAVEFQSKLGATTTFNDILSLWQQTNLIYKMSNIDAYSQDYKYEVLETYEALTGLKYVESNELTSSKQDEEAFLTGYPWISQNLDVISKELAKSVQALNAISQLGLTSCRVAEFGVGWGNLAVPLAKAGLEVIAIDIDPGFLKRLEVIAQHEKVIIETINADFITAANTFRNEVDVAIFQASFHHCLDFITLLNDIRKTVLSDRGVILFLSEPIYKDYRYPWGLRSDGESLWAIMCNKWLELGFDHDFFSECLMKSGFFLREIDGIDGYVGSGWAGIPLKQGINFELWSMRKEFDLTFWPSTQGGFGRFCRSESYLPSLADSVQKQTLTFYNYHSEKLNVKVSADTEIYATVFPKEFWSVTVGASEILKIESETFTPDTNQKNGDFRKLGLALKRIEISDE